LWVLARADLIADPPEARKYRRYRMVLTAEGQAAMANYEQTKKSPAMKPSLR